MNSHEREFINHFVKAHRRERWRQLLADDSNTKNRNKLTRFCLDSREFDGRYAVEDEESLVATSRLQCGLAAHGAQGVCYLISENPAIDRRTLPLADALQEVIGSGLCTILSCVPGRLAFYEGERSRMMFVRKI